MEINGRKVIFKARVGSHLYGTNRPESDEDFIGVFMPLPEDLLGLSPKQQEIKDSIKVSNGPRNSAGDVDCKYYSLNKFLKLATEGQSCAIELFFAEPIIEEPEWVQIKEFAKEKIFSQNSIKPFVGFALAQAHKSVIKGGNLNKIRRILQGITDHIPHYNTDKGPLVVADIIDTSDDAFCTIFGEEVIIKTAEKGAKVVEIAGRMYDINLPVKRFRNSLEKLEETYGSRSEIAAENGIDLKSLYHAYRLISEAKEFIMTGHITFPRPDAEFLKTISAGLWNVDYGEAIQRDLDHLRELEKTSSLRNKPDYSAVDKFCIDMLTWYFIQTHFTAVG
jgi:hypothetical protein